MEAGGKSKEDVLNELNALKAAFEELIGAYESGKALYDETEYLLNERIKELNCHNRISKIMSRSDISVSEMAREVVSILPDGWQFPNIAGALIQANGNIYQSDRYDPSGWILSRELVVFGEKVGRIEVSYHKSKKIEAGNPFLAEEVELLFSIAERVSNFLERSRTNISLSESELKFRNLIEGITDVIYEIDKNGIIVYISPSIEKLCGFSQEEIIGQHFQNFVGTNAAYLGQRIKILAQAGEIENDYRIKAKTGEYHWIRFSSKAIYKDALFVGGTGTLVDITEKKRIEFELQKSEALYRSILHASPDVITITDLSGRIMFASPKAATMFGLDSADETIDHSLLDYILPEDHARATLNISKMLEGEFGGAEVYTGKRKDGSFFDIEVNGEFIRDMEGEPTGLIFVTRDISEWRKTEEKLRKNEENFRFLVETINDAIYEIDKNGTINYVSPAIEKILGFKPEELIGTNFFTYMYPEDVPILRKALSILGEVDSSHLEYRYITREGLVKWVSSSTSPIKKDGVVVGGTGSLTDITDRKLAENEIRKLSVAVEQSPVSIVITNLDGNIEYANPKVLETTGYTLGELIGKNPRVLKSGETAPDEYDILWNSITSGNNWHGIFHNRKKDGTFYWESSTISPILDQQGNITHYLAVKEDITERIKNEEALRNSEERFSQLAEQSQTVIWEVDAEGLYTFASAMSLVVWGYTPDELVGKMHFYDLHPVGGRSSYKEEVLSLFSQKVSFKNVTNQIITKKGKLIWVLTNGIPILDGSEKLVGYRGADNDITDKIQKDNELKKLSLAVEQSPVSIVITDLHAHVEYVNPSFELTTLYKSAEVIGQSTSILKSGETADEVYKEMWETITAGLQWQGEWLNRKKSGELFWENVLITPIIDEQNRITNYLAVKQDITKRKEAEREILSLNANLESRIEERTIQIRLSEEKFATAFQSNSVMMSIAHFETGLFVDVNNEFIETSGYSRSEVIGKTSSELQLFVDPNLREEIRQSLNNNIPVRKKEIQMRIKDGTLKTILISCDSIFIGNVRCLLSVTMDISERIKAEEQLRQARNEAEQANMAKSEFLSRMSHELRTPMNSILGFAQLLEMGDLNPGQRKGVNHIKKSGKHLLDLINEVLDISRIEAGHLSLSLEPVKISEVIHEMIDIVRQHAMERSVTIEIDSSNDKFLCVQSDKQRLKQILLNLMNNAIKYNKVGGSVTLETKLLPAKISGVAPVRISVKDSGFGISASDIPKLFIPFERIGAEKTDTEGTGLGLSVVKKLTVAMGGEIGVESVVGEGSTFWVEFPLSEGGSNAIGKIVPSEGNNPKGDCKQGVILYIEDNASNIVLVEEIISTQRSNIRLITNAFGQNALPLALEYMPDIILLDLNLPDMHGSEVLKILQSNEITCEIPVVVISADAMPQQIAHLMAMGARRYITKPMDLTVILKIIDEYTAVKE